MVLFLDWIENTVLKSTEFDLNQTNACLGSEESFFKLFGNLTTLQRFEVFYYFDVGKILTRSF